MRKGWMRVSLAFGLASTVVLLSGTAASAAKAVLAKNDNVTTTAGTPVTIHVTENDDVVTGATGQTVVLLATTTNGTLTKSGGAFHYTPNAGFTGIDRFKYQLCARTPSTATYGAGDLVCDNADVAVIVNADTSVSGTGDVGTYGSGDVQPYGAGDVAGIGSGGSLPTTGTGANLLVLLGVALVLGGFSCYGACRDNTRALVR
jgi:LPXTG-motif cell wall-anchored protein